MDGVAGVTARIATIESRISSISSLTAAPRPASTGSAAFANVLAGTVSAGGAATPATASGKVNAKGVPVELAGYGNGKIPPNALRPVGSTGHRLWAPAAQALEQLMAAAARDGVRIGVTDSYRPYAEQVDLARRKGLYSEGGLAAKPGTSDHGWGMAVDLDLNPKAQAWMRANAAKFGFEEDTPREPWHWGFKVK